MFYFIVFWEQNPGARVPKSSFNLLVHQDLKLPVSTRSSDLDSRFSKPKSPSQLFLSRQLNAKEHWMTRQKQKTLETWTNWVLKTWKSSLEKKITNIFFYIHRAVTKISSCRLNTTSRWGIKWLAIFLILFFFYLKVAGGLEVLSSRRKSLAPRISMTALYSLLEKISSNDLFLKKNNNNHSHVEQMHQLTTLACTI